MQVSASHACKNHDERRCPPANRDQRRFHSPSVHPSLPPAAPYTRDDSNRLPGFYMITNGYHRNRLARITAIKFQLSGGKLIFFPPSVAGIALVEKTL